MRKYYTVETNERLNPYSWRTLAEFKTEAKARERFEAEVTKEPFYAVRVLGPDGKAIALFGGR